MPQAIIASTNPVKIDAVRRALERMFPQQAWTVCGRDLPSGVPDQPMSDAETLQGALNRARNARNAVPDAQLWLGIEGGLEPVGEVLRCFAWVQMLTPDSAGRSRTATHDLPDEVARLVRAGLELGSANDHVFGRSNSKQGSGSVGILSGDALTRTEYYAQAVLLALIPLRNSDLHFQSP